MTGAIPIVMLMHPIVMWRKRKRISCIWKEGYHRKQKPDLKGRKQFPGIIMLVTGLVIPHIPFLSSFLSGNWLGVNWLGVYSSLFPVLSGID